MDQPRLQFSVAGLLGLVACVALNVWLFRLGPLLGLLGLNITRHVVVAYVCQQAGVDRVDEVGPPALTSPQAQVPTSSP